MTNIGRRQLRTHLRRRSNSGIALRPLFSLREGAISPIIPQLVATKHPSRKATVRQAEEEEVRHRRNRLNSINSETTSRHCLPCL